MNATNKGYKTLRDAKQASRVVLAISKALHEAMQSLPEDTLAMGKLQKIVVNADAGSNSISVRLSHPESILSGHSFL